MKKCIDLLIGKTTIKKEIDEYGLDFSGDLGKFTNDIKPGVYIRSMDEFYERLPAPMERDIDGGFYQKGEPDYPTYSREYDGIIPTNHIPFNPKDWSHVKKKDKSEVIKKYGSLKNASYAYALEDCRRLDALNYGHWHYVTVVVKTTINADNGMSDYVCNTLSGIDSDSGKDCFDEIIADLKCQNRQELLKMGFTEKEIDESLNNADEVE